MTAECDRCITVKPTIELARTDDDQLRMLCADCRYDLRGHVRLEPPLKDDRENNSKRKS